MTLIDAIRPVHQIRRITFDVMCILSASLLLAFLSQIEFHLWFTPVPITLQTFGVILIAAALGGKRGSLAMLAYLGEGALGFPVFAGGASGIAVFAGPTAGYLCGFVAAVFIMGFYFERSTKSIVKNMMIASLGSLIMLFIGTLWLGCFVSFSSALLMGFYPFIWGSLLKSIFAAILISAGSIPKST
jgi:biotin transport system substrate-specific component